MEKRIRAGSFSFDLGIDDLIGYGGFSSCLACTLSLAVFAPTVVAPELVIPVGRCIGDTALGGGFFSAIFLMVIAAWLVRQFGYASSRHDHRLFMIVSTVGACAYAVLLMLPEASLLGRIVLCSVAAACEVFALALWFAILCLYDLRNSALRISLSFATAFALCLICALLPEYAARALLCVLDLVSFFGIFAYPRSGKRIHQAHDIVDNKISRSHMKIERSQDIMLSLCYLEFGFILVVAILTDRILFLLGVACIVALLLSLDAIVCFSVTERRLYSITPPVAMFSFSALFLFEDVMSFVALALLTAVPLTYILIAWQALGEHVRLSKLSPFHVYGRARIMDFFGLVIGFLVGSAACFVLFESGNMEAARLGVAISACHGICSALFHRPRFPEAYMNKEEREDVEGRRGMWKKRCRTFAEHHDLSERQLEVLLLFTQGRTARSIAETLSISVSTVQTHIRNIYTKIGLHSRQELIDSIEETKLYGED